ncbi:MAG: hypothetical protein K2N67_04555, partial [Mucispirillum sp.]|nr:hypothetical protein [Mucispirillum sp.]
MWLINPIYPTKVDVSIPDLNDAITKNLGDELLVQGFNTITKCIDMKEDNKDKTVKAGRYVLSSTFNNREVYEVVPLSGAYLAGYLATPPQGMKLFYNEEKLCSGFINPYGYVMCREPIPNSIYDFQSCTVSHFIETLIYTGRDNNILKFL